MLRKWQDAVAVSKDTWSPSKGGSENRSLSSLFSKESPSRDTAEKWHLGMWLRKTVSVTGFRSRQERTTSLVHHLCSRLSLSPYLTIQCNTWSIYKDPVETHTRDTPKDANLKISVPPMQKVCPQERNWGDFWEPKSKVTSWLGLEFLGQVGHWTWASYLNIHFASSQLAGNTASELREVWRKAYVSLCS